MISTSTISHARLALRRLATDPALSAVKVGGLVVGMTCAMLVALAIRLELGADRQHEHHERIYELRWHELEATMGRLAPLVGEALPEIESVVRLRSYAPLLSHEEQRFYQPITFADSTVFDVFTLPLVAGDPASVLREPYAMVLSESVARKFFGDDDPLGKTLLWDNTHAYTVRGVMADLPYGRIRFEILASMRTMMERPEWEGQPWYATWVVVAPGFRYDPDDFGRRGLGLYRHHAAEPEKTPTPPRLESLADHHLTPGMMRVLYVLTTIGVVVLLVACVNYTSLTTAHAMSRARETGVRRTIGARRGQLVWQYFVESGLVVLIAWGTAILLTWNLLPAFAGFWKDVRPAARPDLTLALMLGAIAVLPAVGAGLYPALVLSGFQPARGLRATAVRGGAWVRKGLVVAQFAVAAFLIVASVTVYGQLSYMADKDLGFEPENLVTFSVHNRESWMRYPVFASKLASSPHVEGVSATRTLPSTYLEQASCAWEGGGEPRVVDILGGERRFVDVYGMRLLAGRSFADDPDGADVCVVNRSMVAALGASSPEQVLGRSLTWELDTPRWGAGQVDDMHYARTTTIVGVVEDVYWRSLYADSGPTILFPDRGFGSNIAIRIAGRDRRAAMADLRQAWSEAIPELPFKGEFLEDRIAARYFPEERMARVVTVVATVAALLTLVGLLGLSALLVQQRTRSIAVRKVLGCSPAGLIRLMTSEWLWLVVGGNLLAVPATHRAVTWWLGDFAYRFDVSALEYAAAGAATIAVAWLTVGSQTLKVVLASPMEALRHE